MEYNIWDEASASLVHTTISLLATICSIKYFIIKSNVGRTYCKACQKLLRSLKFDIFKNAIEYVLWTVCDTSNVKIVSDL